MFLALLVEQRDETLFEILKLQLIKLLLLSKVELLLSDALHGIIILGRVIRDNVIPATNGVDLGNSITLNNIPNPNKSVNY